MKKEDSLAIIQTEIERWERFKDIVNAFKPGKKYKIIFKYNEYKEAEPGNWRTRYFVEQESVFIGSLKEYNKASINFLVYAIQDVEKSDFRYKMSTFLSDIKRARDILDRNMPAWYNDNDRDEKWAKRTLNKKFSCSVKLDDFISWEEWEPDQAEAPLMVNYDYLSEDLRKIYFGA